MKPYCIYTLGLILLACAILTACMEEEDAELQTQLVVEGWIEDGGYPVVLLGETHAIDAGMQNIENYIVRWGKVTISDGTDSVILTGGYDNDFFPPYKYTTFKMTGQAGKTYTLTAEYRGKKATAVTTIPQPVELDSLHVVRSESDTLFYIKAFLKTIPTKGTTMDCSAKDTEKTKLFSYLSWGYSRMKSSPRTWRPTCTAGPPSIRKPTGTHPPISKRTTWYK